jgi:membrane associated rhomboid family serine protease
VTVGALRGSGARGAELMIAQARRALWVMAGVLTVLWVAQIINWADGYRLSYEYGTRARDIGSLPTILTAPLLHFSWGHLEANSGPLFIFGFLSAYRGIRKFVGVTALIVVGSGLGAWLTGAPNSISAGASGVVFGYFGYVIVRGLFDRHGIDIVIGIVMALCFAYQLAVIVPGTPGVSWQAHLFGFVTGIIGGWIFRERRPASPAGAAPSSPVVPTVPPVNPIKPTG